MNPMAWIGSYPNPSEIQMIKPVLVSHFVSARTVPAAFWAANIHGGGTEPPTLGRPEGYDL
jgi:hypothetical protein